MLLQRDSQISDEPTVFCNGIELNQAQYHKIKKRIDLLSEKCPSHCSFNLSFKKQGPNYIGQITIKSLTKEFYSKKATHNLYQTYLLLEEDIEQQLLKWKRQRFNKNFAENLHGPGRGTTNI